MTDTNLLDPTTNNEEKIQHPKMYKVVLHNDDYTPFELVVAILMASFRHDEQTSIQLMMAAHTTGKVICGVYSKDVAETKATEACNMAKKYDYALNFTTELDQ